MELKKYQTETLSTLRRFLEEARIAGPKGAYEAVTKEPEIAARLGRYAGDYEPLNNLANVPYVCLRLPTGGGKTLLGAHSISIARDAWVEKDYPMVLWLVPSKTIRLQTVDALKNPNHSYRQALDEAFGGRVRVFDIADFTHIRPQDIRDHCCIVVGTIQTLRVKDTEGRKVYAHNENLEPHFSALPKSPTGLETLEGGGVKFSFANLMHIHRPLMIVDEAQKAVTGLTREMQTRVNPSAIIEFTATPRARSNILYSVTAQELKAEEMIKLPIMLSEYDNWQNAVNGAVSTRAGLAETAKDDPGYIRPIVLFQAQPKNQEVTVEELKKHLIESEQIAEEKIAVATGDQRELDGINLFDPKCEIEYVITVEALKEGWDCSFAYVFCSVSRIKSAIDVEQLLGRVLRMPYAKRRKADELNRAYACLSEPSFSEAAKSLVDTLVSMGFQEEEAQESIEQLQLGNGDSAALFDKPEETFKYKLTATSGEVGEIEKQEGVSLRETGEGEYEIEITGLIDDKREEAITELLPETRQEEIKGAIQKYRAEAQREPSPAERGESFKVPRLMSEIQGELELADTDVFMEFHEWSLLDHSSKMDESEFAIHETTRSFEIDLDGNRLTYQFASENEQLGLDIDIEGWTPEALVLWLDRQVRQPDIHQSKLLKWLSGMVGHLVNVRKMRIAALMRCKFILARKIREKLNKIRLEECGKSYQKYLFAPEAKTAVSFDTGFEFKENMYSGQRLYRGAWKPRKHFLSDVPAFDGVEGGEEFQCAQAIDSMAGVKFWVRNVAKHENSFCLPTAKGGFYPDFIAQLEDGRQLVVEYKGDLLADSADTAEKRTIGELLESRSEGKMLFIIVEKTVDGKDMREQLAGKVGDV